MTEQPSTEPLHHHQQVAIHTTTNNNNIMLWELPDVILFHIVSFVAPPTRRATVLCHQLAVLCKHAKRAILDNYDNDNVDALNSNVALWDTILKQDYGISSSSSSSNFDDGEYRAALARGGGGDGGERRQRRACKRLRRTPVQKVRDAHGTLVLALLGGVGMLRTEK
jgi:hypothetical protein